MTGNKKLHPLAEMLLIGEIVRQSRFSEMAAAQLAKTSDSEEMWASIQSFLVATANVSKILWPTKKKYKARGEQLRKSIGVDDNNVLSNRNIRNHFEHYDERVEDWFDENNSVCYRDSKIDPFESSPLSMPGFYHRCYNPSNQKLSFRNESIDLSEILAAIGEIREKCRLFDLHDPKPPEI